MFKAFTPIIAILIAVGLFFTYVQPTFEDIRSTQDETSEYEEAIDKAAQLRARITELNNARSSLTISDLERLEAFLPDRVDEVELLIDLDTLANNNSLSFSNINVQMSETSEEEVAPRSRGAVQSDAEFDENGEELRDPNYSSLDIDFTVSGTYQDFREFLRNVEQSLVMMEVMSISFAESEGDLLEFSVTVRVFSLNAPS